MRSSMTLRGTKLNLMACRRKWQPTPVFLPGKSHGQRSLVGYSPWGHKESDTTERLNGSSSRSPVTCPFHPHNSSHSMLSLLSCLFVFPLNCGLLENRNCILLNCITLEPHTVLTYRKCSINLCLSNEWWNTKGFRVPNHYLQQLAGSSVYRDSCVCVYVCVCMCMCVCVCTHQKEMNVIHSENFNG